MQDYRAIRSNIDNAWPARTYLQELDFCKKISRNKQLKNRTASVLRALGVADKPMTGSSMQGIAKKTEQRTRVNFSKTFRTCAESYLSPAAYVAAIVEACTDQGLDLNATAYQAGRGLRAFASFLRELDLEHKLAEELGRRGMRARTDTSAEQDVKFHTDVFLTVFVDEGAEEESAGSPKEEPGFEYRLWSYLPTPRGKENLVRKLEGGRKSGAVVAGVHVLCPLTGKGGTTRVQDWLLYSDEYIERLARLIDADARAQTKMPSASAEQAPQRVPFETLLKTPNRYLRDICFFVKE